MKQCYSLIPGAFLLALLAVPPAVMASGPPDYSRLPEKYRKQLSPEELAKGMPRTAPGNVVDVTDVAGEKPSPEKTAKKRVPHYGEIIIVPEQGSQ